MVETISHILRDPIWQAIGAIFAIIAIIITIVLYLKQKLTKELSYDITTNQQLLSVQEELKGKLKVTFENKQVEKIQLLIVKFVNTGNISIPKSDFDQEISVNFNKPSRVLSAEIASLDPKTLQSPTLTIQDDKVSIEPILMNRKDNFQVKLLISDYTGMPQISWRVIGISDVKRVRKPTKYQDSTKRLGNWIIIWAAGSLIPILLVNNIITLVYVSVLLSLVVVTVLFVIVDILRDSIMTSWENASTGK